MSTPIPSAAKLEHALRHAVQVVYKTGNLEELTVKRVRRAAEEALGLDEGFFKTDLEWKDRSKEIISAEVEAHENDGEPNSKVQIPEKSKAKALTSKREMEEGQKVKGVKRKGNDEAPSKKRRKKREGCGDDVSELEGQKHSNLRNEKRRSASTPSPPSSEAVTKGQEASPPIKLSISGAEPEQSESEMSVLIDEPLKKKGRSKGRLKTPDSTKPGKENKQPPAMNHKRKSNAEEAPDPDQEEIKRLQGWLVKCGIRKMWWKELQPFETPREKITHLKDMLTEAGMVGRYSQEKAAHIREERELKADLEAVQEGARIWGKGDDEDAVNAGGVKLKRQVAKGLQELDFLNDDDGEETD